ncbi:response regulator transcription factor [Granulibacter bethesdensis]|uniref:Transcriptional regulator, LuxR family n=1 Tax=Granulibacter bethesdensis (strain ATCC BAA-1260 / CGDNIH1) TaxID=391165 RepID=Q0BR16_GRABC|nr:response regulator transcription factor [Granulibacter bethesdensis]ABI62736.1 Transcriptional regulator, LuxR family [Granulibacter bethesdensis CGDNIH1]AHJ68322.1 Transcriptional regulator, LuxR family [Granulibacter bethesdensis]APH52595.1 Transcriptional regulator, LuxR family [Granulibacter bethesdensis]APH65284.1 Transcriptional regulator, LuxR family [Granulibacter bethesdensis]
MTPRDIVLLVDDTPGSLSVLHDALDMAGYTVLVAQSGQAALTLIEQVTPDIILLDAIMPGLDGFETCRRLKQHPTYAMIPVIFMTGLTDTKHVVQALQCGGVDYVTKPVSPEQVLARITVHLGNARLMQSAHVALDRAGRYLFAVDATGHISWSTPQAALLLGASDGRPVLPAFLLPWIAECASGEAMTGSRRVVVESRLSPEGTGSREVEIVFFGTSREDEILMRLIINDPAEEQTILHQRLPVTAREAEVLLWIGRGKQNRDIADILGLSPRTVNKHLEQIYTKIGVENRAAAAAVVMKLLASR